MTLFQSHRNISPSRARHSRTCIINYRCVFCELPLLPGSFETLALSAGSTQKGCFWGGSCWHCTAIGPSSAGHLDRQKILPLLPRDIPALAEEADEVLFKNTVEDLHSQNQLVQLVQTSRGISNHLVVAMPPDVVTFQAQVMLTSPALLSCNQKALRMFLGGPCLHCTPTGPSRAGPGGPTRELTAVDKRHCSRSRSQPWWKISNVTICLHSLYAHPVACQILLRWLHAEGSWRVLLWRHAHLIVHLFNQHQCNMWMR